MPYKPSKQELEKLKKTKTTLAKTAANDKLSGQYQKREAAEKPKYVVLKFAKK